MPPTRPDLRPAVHVFGLWALAAAHPLLDVLGRSPAFFVAHGFQRTETLLFLAALMLAAPLVLALAVGTAGLAGRRLRDAALAIVVAVLCGTLAAQALKHAGLQTWWIVFPAAAAIGMVAGAAYLRVAAMRSVATVLSAAVLIVPAVFLARPGVSALLASPDAPAAELRVDLRAFRPAPVVLIVADEIPLVSLLDANGDIDAALYPHIAALARDGRWFRNATTVSDYTSWAVPAILTGRYPKGDSLPNAADHPENLFVLLARTHRMQVVEAGTELCPRSICVRPRDPWRERLAWFASDLRIVALHVLLTDDLRVSLPPLTGDWANFDPGGWRRERRRQRAAAHARRPDRQEIVRRYIESLEPPGEQPALYYLHSLLTHWPHRFLPTGQRNATAAALPGEVRMGWNEDDWAIAQHYQRHLLNLQLFDGLLGGLVGRLKAIGVYDRALIVLTSDHGTAFRAGGLRRGFTREIAADVMRVPLIVKLPPGVSWPAGANGSLAEPRVVETIDVAPTIAGALGLELPWSADGSSLLDPDAPARRARRILFDSGTRTDTFPPEGPDLREALGRKIALFGGPENRHRAPRPDRFSALIGRPIDGLRVENGHVRVTLDHASRFENVDRRSAAVPFDVGGTLEPAPEPPAYVAVALNGTVTAVTRTWESTPGGFMATPPLDAWRQGRNQVDVFLIEGTERNPLLRRADLLPAAGSPASAKARR